MKNKILLASGFLLCVSTWGTVNADNSGTVPPNQPMTLAYHGGGHFGGGHHGGFHRGYGHRHGGWGGGWGHRRVGWGGGYGNRGLGWGGIGVGYCRFNYCGPSYRVYPRYQVGRYCVNKVKPIFWRGKYGKLHKRYVRKIVCYRRW